MKLLVCGGRDFTDIEFAVARLQRLHNSTPVTKLICGMARGGDMIGFHWAKETGIPVEEYYADWNHDGRAAGGKRNQRMLDEGQPDRVVALPGGSGTAHMVKISQKAGVPVTVYEKLLFSRARDPKYGFLSNFWLREQVDSNGVRYRSNEHYYQAEKTENPEIREWIVESPDPTIAKKRGNHDSVPLREGWNGYKIIAMRNGLRMKFARGSELAEKLIETGDLYLVEFAPWGDTFWGVDKNYEGQNYLGRLLMQRRDELIWE